MQDKTYLPRRSFLLATAGSAAAVLATTTAGCGASGDRQLQFSTLAQAEQELMRLALAKERVAHAKWNWAQTLVHCSQSIEYSMTGFPEAKSRLFQQTLGAAAFGVFSWRGRMTHDLAEPIPGAPALAEDSVEALALVRLRAAIVAFRLWPGKLAPHFAYGELDKAAYEKAHAMHLANHLSYFNAQA